MVPGADIALGIVELCVDHNKKPSAAAAAAGVDVVVVVEDVVVACAGSECAGSECGAFAAAESAAVADAAFEIGVVACESVEFVVAKALLAEVHL